MLELRPPTVHDSGGDGGGGHGHCHRYSPHVVAQPKVRWRPTASGLALDWHQGVAERLIKLVGDTSGGQFQIGVFSGGQNMEPFCFFAEETHGEEGARVLHEVPGAGRPVGPRGHQLEAG